MKPLGLLHKHSEHSSNDSLLVATTWLIGSCFRHCPMRPRPLAHRKSSSPHRPGKDKTVLGKNGSAERKDFTRGQETAFMCSPGLCGSRSALSPAWKSLSGCTVAGVRIPCFQTQFPESVRNFEDWDLYKPIRNFYFFLEGICLPVS